jgi:hypothetical protein
MGSRLIAHVLQCVFDDGEVITWNKVTTSIRNLILGKIYVEHSGTMKVQSEQMPIEVRIKFRDSGIISSSSHEISGRLHEDGRDLQSHKYALCLHSSISMSFRHLRGHSSHEMNGCIERRSAQHDS